MASAVTGSGLPAGGRVFTTFPDILFIPEFIFGGLVWCLVASTRVSPPNPQGWVMFVSIFCFVMTTLWFFIFVGGCNQSGAWPGIDVMYHFIAVLFYLSASVALAYTTLFYKALLTTPPDVFFKPYQENVAAVVFAYITTLLYFLHAIFSALRWKSL